jgi:predicted ATPase
LVEEASGAALGRGPTLMIGPPWSIAATSAAETRSAPVYGGTTMPTLSFGASIPDHAEAKPHSPEAGVAYRAAGITHWFAGEYREAREHLERALTLFQPGRDDDLAFRFGQDPGVAAMLFLALTLWPLGDIGRAVSLVGEAEARIAGLAHIHTRAYGKCHATLFELMRGDLSRAALNAAELARLAHVHDLLLWRAFAVFFEGLAKAQSGAFGGGIEQMHHGAELLRQQNVVINDGLVKIALAESEARADDVDRALAVLDEALATSERIGHRTYDAELHRVRGEMLLKRAPANPAPAEEALQTAIAVSKQQATRSFELRAALALAKLYQSTAHPVEAHAVLTPALEGFTLAPEMPEIAEAQALLAALAETDEVKATETQRQRRLHLQTQYGQAMMWSKGFAAEESKAAFARAAELAAKSDDFSERFAAAHGQWTVAILHGELKSAQGLASAFLRQAQELGRLTEAGVACRGLALISYFLGDFVEARTHCERALEVCDPEHEEDARERFGEYTGTIATTFLASANWQLGEVERAHELMETANRRAVELGHVPSMAIPLFSKSILAVQRGDAAATLKGAEALEALAREHGMALHRTWAELLAGWARGRLHDPAGGAAELRRALAVLAERGQRLDVPLYSALLAELEAETLDADSALARIEEALALANQVEQRFHLAFIHRLRGEILLKGDPINPALAEEAFQAAIAIATQQGARSFGLLASLALAKLHQSTGRPADAHAVLAPALEGFAPTPEMPEIAEARALLAALAQTDEVKAHEARREQRLHLQTAYGQAMMSAKGYAAEETKAAFARAAEMAGRTDDYSERFAVLQGQWAAAATGGELRSARQLALTLLREAEDAGRVWAVGAANWWLGLIAYWQGELVEARSLHERALAVSDSNPDSKLQEADSKLLEALGDFRTLASSTFAAPLWQLGEVERARELINTAIRRASEIGHIWAIAEALFYKSYLEVLRSDPVATSAAAEALEVVAREHGMMQHLNEAELHSGWARGRIDDPMAGAAQVRRVLAAFVDQGVRVNLGFYTGLLAQLEAETLGADSALARIDEAFRLSNAVEHGCSLPFLHRLRGELFLKGDPINPALAEEAFQTSIAIAKEQSARSPVLLASLALAKLYQSTGRPAKARAMLAPALEGFSPTPEMPEIAEAQALLSRLP